MSLNLLRSTLLRLSASETAPLRPLLKDSFILIEHLINPKNVDVLIRALLISKAWDHYAESAICHDFMYASRFLSTEKVILHNKCLLKAVRDTQCPTWHKSVLLAALTYAEMRGTKGVELSWYSLKGIFGRSYVSSILQEGDTACCALIITLSYIWPCLTAYQQGRLDDNSKIACIKGLYESGMLFDRTREPFTTTSNFKELGLLSRTASSVCTDMSIASCETALDMLLRASTILQDNGISINIKKSLFLSIITIQQAVMASALRHSLLPGHSESMATKSLSILRNMQGINLDNAVFESWRFCFNLSLDMLANEPRALTRYLDNLLQSSPLSRNPLSTKFHKTLFSKNVDDVDVTWLLIVVESTSTIIQSPDTCQRIFNHCFEGLIHMQGSQNKELMELYQSVVLSFFTSKYELFSSRGSDFIAHVLRDSTSITDRQFQVIFTSLYRLSLASEPSKAIEDPLHILSDIKDEFRKSQDVAVQEKLLSTIVQMLPIMRPSFLLRNLKYADASIQQLDTSNRLREKFNDVCTTEMDSERAVITVKYMLSRNEEKYEERARL